MNYHVMKYPIVTVFQIIAQNVANALILSSHPIDRLLTHNSAVSVLSFVHGMHVEIVLEFTSIEELHDGLKKNRHTMFFDDMEKCMFPTNLCDFITWSR